MNALRKRKLISLQGSNDHEQVSFVGAYMYTSVWCEVVIMRIMCRCSTAVLQYCSEWPLTILKCYVVCGVYRGYPGGHNRMRGRRRRSCAARPPPSDHPSSWSHITGRRSAWQGLCLPDRTSCWQDILRLTQGCI